MSNSHPPNYDKSEITGSTIGFIFHANHEELEEVQSKQDNIGVENNENKTDNLISESLVGAKSVLDNNEVTDGARDHKSLFGKRSISIDCAYESPFSNPIETLKKLNVLKEKLTKTVEGKILEMKIDRNVLGKSNRTKLIHSKENSSVSDSEDTSESSKLSEQWKDTENQNFLIDQSLNENPETPFNTSNTQVQENVSKEIGSKESESELRIRKSFTNFPEIINLSDIKIATAKSDPEGKSSSFSEDVESGVEADENLDATEEESIDLFDGEAFVTGGGSQNPPGGSSCFLNFLQFFTSEVLPQRNTIVLLLGFTMYYFFPLSEFIRGFLLSLLLILFWGTARNYVQYDESSQKQRPFVIPDYKSMPPLKVPESKSVKGIWFNEYEKETYDPDYYSVTHTVPAYLELEENFLKISRPKGKICRRATYDEPEYKLQFISQRIYNISGCNIYLMPNGLTRKRLFSKKYPIVIFLRPDSLILEKKNGKEVEEKELQENAEAETASLIRSRSESPKNMGTLYLFARCDRQKEEWYRKLLTATRLPPSDCQKNGKISEAVEDADNETEKSSLDDSPNKEPCTPFENLFFDDEVAQIEEYLRYMSNFVDDVTHRAVKIKSRSSWYGKLKLKKKSTEINLPKISGNTHSQEEDSGHLPLKNSIFSPLNKKRKASTISVNSEESEEKKSKETSYSNQAQWFNAFVNRILFDVFRSPYWLNKIRNKVQRKLNSVRDFCRSKIQLTEKKEKKELVTRVKRAFKNILKAPEKINLNFHRLLCLKYVHLPYYIEDIEVVEMDLGKTGPMFHRVSQPCLDERGLWFDMDLTFDGLIKLTIQTHLNLNKLQRGMEENEETESQITGKPKKGKKKHRIEKESKDSFLIKDSKENSSCEKLNENPKIEPKPSEECDCSLIKEVTQLAEIAIEESLDKSKKAQSEIVIKCLCTEAEEKRSPIYDSELEDSAESSDEDEEEEETQALQHPEVEEHQPETGARRYPRTRKSSKRIFKVFENVAQSKYFRSVAQSKYVQKAIAGVSAAKLRLTLEIKSCTGILAVNIPPPPSDRFWCGFREMPTLVFSANPKIGDKALRFVHIKNFLQKKILHELKKVMVSPNMIDFVLPTSAPTQSSSFLQIEEPDLQETMLSE